MDYDTFRKKFEAIRDTVAIDVETGAIAADAKRTHGALEAMQRYMKLVGHFRAIDFVRMSETHDMTEVHKTITEAAEFTQSLLTHFHVQLQEARSKVENNA
jgi:hypothetical protein